MKPQLQRTLGDEEQKELIADYQSGSETAEQSLTMLLKQYDRLICSIAKEYPNNRVDIAESIAYGRKGFLESIQKYDKDKNQVPRTYIAQRVRWAIIDGQREYMNIHEGGRKHIPKLRRARDNFLLVYGRDPTDEELSKITGINLIQVRLCNAGEGKTVSGDKTNPNDSDGTKSTLFEMIESEDTESPSARVERRESAEYVYGLIDSAHQRGIISDRESTIFGLYHLIEDPLNLEQIGEIFEITDSRVSQILTKVIKKLRREAETIQKQSLDDII